MAPALLILWGAAVILQVDLLPDRKFLLLPPVNFTIKFMGLSQVLLRWEPNPDQEQWNVNLEYHVKIHTPQEDDYETRKTESKCVIPLHRGISASVQTIAWRQGSLLASTWVSAELHAPPGSPGTSIVNLTCTTTTTMVADNSTALRPYRVSLRCAWLAGKGAPDDVQYFLYYRYGSMTEQCQAYSKDALHRNTACWFPKTFIHSRGHEWLAVHVNGSSKQATIQPFDQLFALHAIDQVNPPMNITAEIQGTRLFIHWEKPVSAFPAQCFDYEVKICNAKNDYFQMEKVTTNEFIATTHAISKYSVQVRATVSSACREPGLWSAWSQPVHAGNDEQAPWAGWFPIALTATFCILSFIFFLVCRIYNLWNKLFPPIPAPKSNIKDFFVATHYEKTGSRDTETEVISYVEEPGMEVLEHSVF
ncbi:interleukin-5 receptor subunit alpha [Perognathus longimembris pacificus]|uniref:interleukin-5 receptor subunit alpha n=1 Tax=Perognathus longimembris pacificus TaxID=214514 RepID=UPI002018D0EF|nr:interleukin-5 receptor subunit alpha [Perognathus longimembris pacificus]